MNKWNPRITCWILEVWFLENVLKPITRIYLVLCTCSVSLLIFSTYYPRPYHLTKDEGLLLNFPAVHPIVKGLYKSFGCSVFFFSVLFSFFFLLQSGNQMDGKAMLKIARHSIHLLNIIINLCDGSNFLGDYRSFHWSHKKHWIMKPSNHREWIFR